MNLKEYIGQDHLKPILQAEIRAAQGINKVLRHGLFFGASGLGKTTLARAIALELGYRFTSLAPEDCVAKSVQATFLKLDCTGYTKGGWPGHNSPKHLVFVDEVHKLPNFEAWYDVLQDRQIAHLGGISWVPLFTFLGATNKPELLPKPFVDRCPLSFTLRSYSVEEYAKIIRGKFPSMDETTAREVGRRSRNSARVALSFAESVLNFGGLGYFEAMGINEEGLTELDRQYIGVLEKATGAMGLGTIASCLRQEPRTVAETIEPYLLSLGKLEITPKGRILTKGFRGALDEAGNFADSLSLRVAG